jgi:hypothetical protein
MIPTIWHGLLQMVRMIAPREKWDGKKLSSDLWVMQPVGSIRTAPVDVTRFSVSRRPTVPALRVVRNHFCGRDAGIKGVRKSSATSLPPFSSLPPVEQVDRHLCKEIAERGLYK